MRTPVMMLHGMCCTGEVWTSFRSYFEAQGARVYTPTLRPEQRVSVLQRPGAELGKLRFADYVSDLAREARRIETEHGRKPVVIGHSMGGLLAYALAEQNCTSAAVAISPSAPAGVRDIQTRVFWAGVHTLNALRLAPPVITPNRRTLKAMVCNALPRPAREAAYRGMVHESGSAFADLGRWPIDEKKIRVPLLTVAASRDKLVPAKLVRMTAKKFAPIGGDFREYGEHAHWLYDEPGWEKPAADIYEWLRVSTLPLDISDQPPRAEHAAEADVRV